MPAKRRIEATKELISAAEPEILTIIGERSKRNKTDKITMRQIDSLIATARKAHRSKIIHSERGG